MNWALQRAQQPLLKQYSSPPDSGLYPLDGGRRDVEPSKQTMFVQVQSLTLHFAPHIHGKHRPHMRTPCGV
eukprot:7160834-Pyramimonas_sp.AAC.2